SLPLIHLDLYRLKELFAEDEEMIDEYLDGHNVVIVEWGERLLIDFPQAYQIRFVSIDGDSRTIELKNFPTKLLSKIKLANF
ncbi:MAG: tRNA (adenosine(37)-N6)-threonylcarbamoyltransferase complex ATPase subunit type 1 TsaE, partial [Lactobacillaceae bacterium]